ncbi:MAG TPA: AAA family ATPase [Kofleriaceae bacterium]
MAVATYPGTVSPLRGLDPFGEAERDVWHGREAERDELARMVTADGFRAGLLFGEPGVGKTSLVRAGLIPHLRDHGIVALVCEDLGSPAQSFAAGLSALGIQPNANELPIAFITRAVSNSVAGQQFVFVVDDVDLASNDDRAIGELAEMFAKVVSRSAGRARFLFVAASERQHLLGALERRTGSLFPPSNRYELPRLAVPAASALFDRVLSLSGVAADPQLADAVVQGIASPNGIACADLQICGMAMRDLRITSLAALQKVGGPQELEGLWLHDACAATGNERSALRLVAELAVGGSGPKPGEAVARKINVDAAFAHHAFQTLEQRGVVVRGDPEGTTWLLRHEVLTQRVRELTAPARAAARKAFDLLGSKANQQGRLKLNELRALQREGIAPITQQEKVLVDRSKRYYLMVAGIVVAIPIVILIIIFISLRGHVFFDEAPRAGGERVVVRGGRSGLSAFSWLPGSGYGKVIADTGLTRAMVAPEVWNKISSRDLGANKSDWEDNLKTMMAPQLAGLVEYAQTGSEAALAELKKAARDPEDLAELLVALRPIARGTPTEVQLIQAAIAMPSPTVQRAAVALAGAAALHHDAYQDTLIKTLTSTDPELRRIAFSAVRNLGERGQALFSAALGKTADADIHHELQVELTSAPTEDKPSSNAAIAVLAEQDKGPKLEKAREELKNLLAVEPDATAGALVGLLANDHAPLENRQWAAETLVDLEPMPKLPNLVDAARNAFASKSPALRAAVLPLYAKVDPERAGGELASMLEDKKLEKPLRIAAALGWGEVAAANRGAAEHALDGMLKEEDADIRAAAAHASGKLGRSFQDRLVKMAKGENFNVRIGAAEGLALSTLSGGNVGVGIDGVAQLWREKGRPRREAVIVWAHLARKKPFPNVVEYLASGARVPDDLGLHPLAVEGLCNAALAGNADARSALRTAATDPAIEVRRIVMACVADGPDPAKNGAAIAAKLVKDPDNEIRVDAARVLALTVGKGKAPAGVGDALVQLLDDSSREVRLVGINALGTLGADAPKAAAAQLAKLFERGDEGEKLAMLRTAKQIGAADLVGLAVADGSPRVRMQAVETALGANLRAAPTLSAALADADPQVRKAALEKLAAQKDKVPAQVLDRALALAVRDPNPELSQLALTTIARVAPKEAVIQRLHRSLASRLERERAQAAAAAIGLVERFPQEGQQLLEPLLDDPSHDVRVAMLPALAAAYAKTNTAEKVADILTDSEGNAMRRLVAGAAFVMLAKTDAGLAASQTVLKKISGPPMAAFTAKIVLGLVTNKDDGIAFLQELVP